MVNRPTGRRRNGTPEEQKGNKSKNFGDFVFFSSPDSKHTACIFDSSKKNDCPGLLWMCSYGLRSSLFLLCHRHHERPNPRNCPCGIVSSPSPFSFSPSQLVGSYAVLYGFQLICFSEDFSGSCHCCFRLPYGSLWFLCRNSWRLVWSSRFFYKNCSVLASTR
jgi:hypothetical protein